MKIVTLNAGLLSLRLPFGLSKIEPAAWVEERLAAIPSVLAELDADVVCLQEIYSQTHKKYIAQALAKVLPYAAYNQNAQLLRVLPDSLMVLSRYPMISEKFIRFRAGRWDEKLLDTKGFLSVDIPTSPLGSMRLVNAHTTAGLLEHPEHPRIDAVRKLQLEQLALYAGQTNKDQKSLIIGDLNCGPAVSDSDQIITPLQLKGGLCIEPSERVSAANYQLLNTLGWRDSYRTLALKEQATWHPMRNPLNAGGDHASRGCPPQRIDHVWLRPEELRPIDGSVCFTEGSVTLPDGRCLPLSDHYGYWVNLEDARSR